jgi:hypothetical protein
MKRLVLLGVGAIIFSLVAGGNSAYAQGTFKIPFKFEAGGKKFPAADYWIAPKDEQQLILRQGPNGEEALIPYAGRLARPKPAIEEPQLVFDMVGNFEPSYTEYVTDYVLAELWLPGADGFLVRAMKGAHQHQTVKGQSAKK